ncbi:MAG: hypothetical protein QOJ57_1917, partial [Thermoleophilaceae bacterium]|nr:hypothetical protein [Thermoleophilaceae bacterium]
MSPARAMPPYASGMEHGQTR